MYGCFKKGDTVVVNIKLPTPVPTQGPTQAPAVVATQAPEQKNTQPPQKRSSSKNRNEYRSEGEANNW